MFRRSLCCAVCSLACGLAAAQAGVPPMKSQGAARYVCGGIGSDESTAMRAAMKEHPLSLLFARASGDYLADVSVEVRNGQGDRVLFLQAGGPVCLIDLPAGRYTVRAAHGEAEKQQAVTIDGSPRTVDFRF